MIGRNNSEDYLLVIYETHESFGRVSEKEVASRLGVSLPTAWEAIHKLEEQELITVERRGLSFTERGREHSSSLMRAHRIIESFAYSFLEIPWEDSDEAVMYLEHGFTGRTLETLHKNMGFPKACPHGNPITVNEKRTELKLSDAAEGTYQVGRIVYEERSFLKELANAGSKPGNTVRIGKEAEKFWVEGENGEFKMEGEMAKGIRLHPDHKK